MRSCLLGQSACGPRYQNPRPRLPIALSLPPFRTHTPHKRAWRRSGTAIAPALRPVSQDHQLPARAFAPPPRPDTLLTRERGAGIAGARVWGAGSETETAIADFVPTLPKNLSPCAPSPTPTALPRSLQTRRAMACTALTPLLLLVAVLAALASGAAAQPSCPPGTALTWTYEPSSGDPTATPVATGTCVTQADGAEAEVTPACPPGTVAVENYEDVDIDNPSAKPLVTITCLPSGAHPKRSVVPMVTATFDVPDPAPAPAPEAATEAHATRSGTQPMVTATLDGSVDVTPAPEPCAAGFVRLTPTAAKCTPW